jgi:hypothetical protein
MNSLNPLLPRLPRRPLIRQPRHHRDHHTHTQQQEHHQRSIQRKLALLAHALEARVAQVARHVRCLRPRVTVHVPARPGLNRVELWAVAVENVRPYDGHECEEEGGKDGAEGDEGAERVFLTEGELEKC